MIVFGRRNKRGLQNLHGLRQILVTHEQWDIQKWKGVSRDLAGNDGFDARFGQHASRQFRVQARRVPSKGANGNKLDFLFFAHSPQYNANCNFAGRFSSAPLNPDPILTVMWQED